MKRWSQNKPNKHSVVDVSGGGSKVRCCKEQCCIGTWNVRSMNQGQLEVVKQEMARVNINILGIRLLCPWDFPGKSTGVGCHCLLPSIVWPQVSDREGTQPHPSTENCIKDLLSMAPPIRTRHSCPQSVSPIRKFP